MKFASFHLTSSWYGPFFFLCLVVFIPSTISSKSIVQVMFVFQLQIYLDLKLQFTLKKLYSYFGSKYTFAIFQMKTKLAISLQEFNLLFIIIFAICSANTYYDTFKF